jgi:hypothetical protein
MPSWCDPCIQLYNGTTRNDRRYFALSSSRVRGIACCALHWVSSHSSSGVLEHVQNTDASLQQPVQINVKPVST